nr:zinc finger CCCH domain-containing protein 32-like [Ipomoea batatas]
MNCYDPQVGLPQMRIWVYPERPGEPTCQYYLRTGLCKFGASCRFHHPRNAGGSLSNAPLNIYGFPLRPEEKECSYYLKTGHCKFGITCTFHHPQPAAISGCAQREKCFFPERPGQPECEYYKKTGNCKFGSSCKFHHPPDWVPPNSNCSFSPLGLPLRPVC